VRSSIGLFLFLLLCWQPNNTNHDKQQDGNSEDKRAILYKLTRKLFQIKTADLIEIYDKNILYDA
jgi:hypothetical protein